MLCLPSRFAPLFFERSWRHAEVLLIGALLAPGKRTVTSLLRMGGLARERRLVNDHWVVNRPGLNRAAWSPRNSSRLLPGCQVKACAPVGTAVLNIDDTIERRRGKRITAKGIYRDPLRSSHGHFVKASGGRYGREHGRQHRKLTDRARQRVLQLRRWCPGRDVVPVARRCDTGHADDRRHGTAPGKAGHLRQATW